MEDIGEVKKGDLSKLSEKRLDICRGCNKFESFLMRCKECRCFMKIKVKFKYMDCPLGNWEELE